MIPQKSSILGLVSLFRSAFGISRNVGRSIKRIIFVVASVALLLALFVPVPASSGPFASTASMWGFGQYIMSFFIDDSTSAKTGRRPVAASPYIESEGNESQTFAPTAYPENAIPCTQSGATTNVPLGQSIQTFINAAGFNGDKLLLAEGTYTEQISLNKCIFIEGHANGTTIKAPATMVNSVISGIGNRRSIVEARANSYSSISNLTISGPVQFDASTYGVFVAETAWLVMDNVRVTDIRLSSGNSGHQNGIGIVVGTSGANQIGRLDATNVTVDDYNKNGIVVDHLGSIAAITGSTVTGSGPLGTPLAAQNGIQFSNGAIGSITGSTVTANEYTEPSWAATGLLTSNSGDVTIKGNTLSGNSESVYSFSSSATSSVITMEDNSIAGGDWGIIAYGVNASISRNTVSGSDIGIGLYVHDAANADFTSNSVTGSTIVGIDVDNFSAGSPVANANVSGSFNRIAGNAIGMYNGTPGIVNAENNFWGCNEGPTVGGSTSCDTMAGSGTIDFDPWLTLTVADPVPATINAGETSTISGASLRINSDDQDTFNAPGNHVINGLIVTYSATNGTLNNASATFTEGLAGGTIFTAPATPAQTETTGVVTAQTDSAQVAKNILISDNEAPTVTINQAGADPTNDPAITFDVVFNENVTGFDASDISVAGSTAGIGLITVDPVGGTSQTHYTVTVNANSSGIVVASIPAGAANDVSANANPNLASTSADNQVAYFSGSIELVVDDLGQNCLANGSPVYTNIPDAVAAANPGHLIRVCSGTYSLTGNHVINKLGLTIMNAEVVKPDINITGGGNLFNIQASNITFSGLNFNKTDGVDQHVISIAAANFTASDNEFTALPWSGTGTTRAFEISGGVSDMLLDGNTITDFRQPAYINGGGTAHVGTISNNIVNGTKGWVVDGAMVDFIDNSFTTCAACDTDIALIAHDATPTVQAFYADRIALSNANNNAHIDVQFTAANDSGRANTYVSNSGSSTNDGQSGSPFASIQQAIYDPTSGIVDGTLPGGTVHVAAGTYTPANGQILVARTINIVGAGLGSTFIDGQNIVPVPSSVGLVRFDTPASIQGSTTFTGFTLRNPGGGGIKAALLAKPRNANATVTITATRIEGSSNADYGLWASHPIGKIVFSNNQVFNTGYNPVLIEQAEGGSEVTGNTINASSGYYNGTYNGIAVSAKQLVANNIFYRSGVAFTTRYGGATSAGKFSDIEITDNKFFATSGASINVENTSSDGVSGEISGVDISENYIDGSPGAGIRLNGRVLSPSVACNTIRDTQWAISVSPWGPTNFPTGVTANSNNFLDNNFGINNSAGVNTVDGTGNFWGAVDGPGPVGPGSGDPVSANVDFSSFLTSASACAPVPETHIPSTADGWYYYDDILNQDLTTPNDYFVGPGTPVLGVGSARMLTTAAGANSKLLFATKEFAGTRFDELDHFSYFTYYSAGSAPYVQIGVDADLTDLNTDWQGRIVWVPVTNGTPAPNTWQMWNASDGLFYGTQSPISTVCGAGSPCTKAELLGHFPNIGIASVPELGLLGFRANESWNASVDAVTVGVNGVYKTFDFEPVLTTVTINQAPGQEDPSDEGAIDFQVIFNEPVTGFDYTDVTLSGTAPGTSVGAVTGSGTTYNVAIDTQDNSAGTIIVTVNAGAVMGSNGPSLASTSTDNTVTLDRIRPQAVIMPTTGQPDPTNGTISFTASFGEVVTGFVAGDVQITNGNITNFTDDGGGNFTIVITAIATGPVTAHIPEYVANDIAGNSSLASGMATVNYDATAPTVTIEQGAAQPDPATAGPIVFDVVFSEPVFGFTTSDIDLSDSTTGGILTAAVTGTDGDSVYTVSVTGMAASGNVIAKIPANAAEDGLGHQSLASTSADNTVGFTVGITPQPVDPSSAPGQLWAYYNDTANAPITGYDFMLGPGSPNVGQGSAGMRTLISTGNASDLLVLGTTQFNGTGLADITQLKYDTFVAAGSGGGVPTLQFNVDFDLTDSNVAYQGRIIWVPTQNGGTVVNDTWQTWDVITPTSVFWYSPAFSPFPTECTQSDPCTLSEMLALHPNMGIGADPTGALLFRVEAGSDAAVDNLIVGRTNVNTVQVNFEPSIPSIVSVVASPAGPTNAASIDFTVTFSEPVTGFDDSDTVFSGIAGTHVVSGSGAVYTVTFTPATNQTGTLELSIAAGVAVGLNSNVPTSNGGSATVVYDNAGPTVTIAEAVGQSDPTSSSPINFAVEFNEPVTGFDASDIILDAGTSGASNVVVTSSGSSYNVAISGMNADGVVSISFAAGAAADALGNLSNAPTITDNEVTFELSNADVVVTPVDLQGWTRANMTGGDSSFVSGPEPPTPAGIGSARMITGPSTSAGGRVWISRQVAAAGIPLASVTELSYSTYISARNGADVAPALRLRVNLSGSGSQAITMVFEPTYSGTLTQIGEWQTWNALAGKWWFADGTVPAGFCNFSNAGPGCQTVSQVLSLYPNARIINSTNAFGFPPASRFGIAFMVGQNGAGGPWNDFDGNIDNFVIGVSSSNTTYDFEPTPPTISVNDVTVNEGNAGTSAATFTVSLSQVSLLPTTVSVSTSDGSATVADNDYVALTNHVVTIPAGQMSATFGVTVNGDLIHEADETFTVTLADAVNGVIDDGTGTGTISNDDAQPTVSVAHVSGGAEPGTPNTFAVSISGQSAFEITVNAATTNGTATAGSDYTTVSSVVTFPAGTATLTQNVVVGTLDDTTPEPIENFTLHLSLPTNATIGTGSAIGTIADSGAYVSISGNIQQYNAPAPNTNLGGVTVTLAGGANQSTTTDPNGNYIFNVGLPAGLNYLVTPSLVSKVFEPMSQSFGNVLSNITNANFVAYETTNIPRVLTVENGYTSPGSPVLVPVRISALGNEDRITFSLDYDETYLSVTQVACGDDVAGCSVVFNDTGTTIAIEIDPTGTLPTGDREIVKITFTTVSTPTLSQAAVNFGDTPGIREISDSGANPLPASYVDGFVVFANGIEGDVTSRFEGNGGVSATDIQMVRNFALGLAAPNPDYNEFQRADTSPLGTNGNGSISATDVQQTLRFALGSDALQPAAGPFFSSLPLADMSSLVADNSFETTDRLGSARDVRLVNAVGSAGNQVVVSIEVDAVGDEAIYGFSMQYDHTVLQNPVLQIGTGAVSGPPVVTAAVFSNEPVPGNIGIVVQFNNRTIAPGTGRQLVTITFDVPLAAPSGITQLIFTDSPLQREISNLAANPLSATFTDGTVTILSPTTANSSVEGKVLSASGRAVSNAVVTIADAAGSTRSVRTNSFGNYRMTGLRAGRSYIVSATAKGYSFQPSTITLNEQITNLNLIAEQ